MTYAVEDINRIVTAMRTDPEVMALFDPSLQGLAPFYLPGHKLYIANQLLVKNNDAVFKEQKYPLIALFMDIPGNVEGGMIKYNLHLAILHHTDRNYTTEQRIELVFKPILYPLYWKFMELLIKLGRFTWPGDRQFPLHNPIDRPYWGMLYEQGTDRYIFNDRLDAIEISDLKISKTIKMCN